MAPSKSAVVVNPSVVPTANVTNSFFCGAASDCAVTNMKFKARWNKTSDRTQDSTGGCVFSSMSGANRCKVGQDGLPVELLQFGVK